MILIDDIEEINLENGSVTTTVTIREDSVFFDKELNGISYKCNIDKFEKGKTYTIKAVEIFGDNELVSFECFIYNNDIECAKAAVNVYKPENASDFLNNGV